MPRKSTPTATPPTKRTSRPAAKTQAAAKTAKVSAPAPSKTAAPKQAAKTKAAAKTVISPAPSREQISVRAYEIWLRKGRPLGQDERNWLQAESELKVKA